MNQDLPDPARRLFILAEVGLVFLLSESVKLLPMEMGIEAFQDGRIPAWPFLLSHLITVPLTVVLLVVAQRTEGRRLADLGFAWPDSVHRAGPASGRQVLVHTVVAFFGLFAVALGLGWMLFSLGYESDTADLFPVEDSRDLTAYWGVSILQGGFLEELLYRGYMLIRLEEVFRRADRPRVGVTIASLVLAFGFGLLHLYQGMSAGIIATALALALTVIVIWQRRNLLVAMLAHALYDMVQFLILYVAPPGSELEAVGH